MKAIDLNKFDRNKLREAFENAKPYRHLVIDNFLKPEFADGLYEHFPSKEEMKGRHYKGYNENKSEGSKFDNYHSDFRQLKSDLMTPEFYKFVSEITGIKDLFITDDEMGRGLHQGVNGSFLDIHIDYNRHAKLDYHRRLNMLIFLNKDWKEEYGGHTELWNKDVTVCERKVLPVMNRALLFETSEISFHGYGKINIPEGVTRKSFFAYFYTKEREGAAGYHDTIFKARPEEGLKKKVVTNVKENLKNSIKKTLKKVGITI